LDAVRFAGASLASGTNVRDGLYRLCRALGGRLGAKVRLASHPESGEIAIPLEFLGEPVGVLCVRRGRPLNEEEREWLEACAVYAAAAAYAERLAGENERLRFAAARDPVTGVANRQAFDAELARSWATASRDGSWLSLIMMDIDWFKKYNDNYGHIAGDACLARVAQAARFCLKRETDVFARFGGEEFVALLWSTGAAEAYDIAESIRAAVEALDIAHVESPIGHVTISVGVAACQPRGGEPDALKRASDRALYAAKTSGRNRVVMNRLETAIGESTTYRGTNNLRAVGTSFLGRSEDAAAIAALLQKHRLVTIAGPGGAGKTRLALALGQRNVYTYLDGAYFADFASVTQADSVEATVAALLGGASGEPGEAIVQLVATKNVLLIFDNCEHVRERVAALAERILAAGPAVTIVATSREPLHVDGEAVYRLGPLDPETAIRLFVERAQAAFPPYAATDEVLPALQRLCERLDNLPLAIELAAPLVKTMSLEDIHAGLEDRFRLLVGTERGASARQQTLLATLDWSVGLLPERERQLLESLSVFPSAAAADAVRDVCAIGGLESWEVMGALNALIEKNLVSAIDRKLNERFVLLESTRDFARRARTAKGDGDALERRFIHYYASLARRIGELAGERLEQCIAVATADWPNLENALALSIDRGIDPEAGIGMSLALAPYWIEGGRHFYGARWTDRALATLPADSPHHAKLLYNAAALAYFRGDFTRQAAFGEALIALYGPDSTDLTGYARALNTLGAAKFNMNEGEAAYALFEKALELFRAAGDRRGTAVNLMNLASIVSEYRHDLSGALELFRESLELFRTLPPSIMLGNALANIGVTLAKLGDYTAALENAGESVQVYESLGNTTLAPWPLVELASCQLALGNANECLEYLRRASAYLANEPNVTYVANYAEVAFALACHRERYDLAARIYGFVERYRLENAIPRLPGDAARFETHAQHLHRQAGPDRVAALAAEGAQLSFADVAAAIDDVASPRTSQTVESR
jgi:diguanylate cyclase (GGDEF)-like protein